MLHKAECAGLTAQANDLRSQLEMCKGDRAELYMEVERLQALRREHLSEIELDARER